MEDRVTCLAETTFIHVNRMEKLPGARLILNIMFNLRSRLRIEVRPTENDLTRLYKNGDISVVITCS